MTCRWCSLKHCKWGTQEESGRQSCVWGWEPPPREEGSSRSAENRCRSKARAGTTKRRGEFCIQIQSLHWKGTILERLMKQYNYAPHQPLGDKPRLMLQQGIIFLKQPCFCMLVSIYLSPNKPEEFSLSDTRYHLDSTFHCISTYRWLE